MKRLWKLLAGLSVATMLAGCDPYFMEGFMSGFCGCGATYEPLGRPSSVTIHGISADGTMYFGDGYAYPNGDIDIMITEF